MAAQFLNVANPSTAYGNRQSIDAIGAAELDFNLFQLGTRDENGPGIQSLSASISQLDLKSPFKARAEYVKGYQLLMKKSWPESIEHLTKATTIYPKFVAAHNALGTAYMNMGQNEQAHGEFAQAVALDDHLPNSYLNLACADLAMKKYPDAEESLKKASSIAPLDIQLQLAMAYGAFVNKDYPTVLETAKQVHGHRHKNGEMVHYFAAGAFQAQDKATDAQHEMETLLKENPKSSSADQFRKILEQMKSDKASGGEAKKQTEELATASFTQGPEQSSEEGARQAQQVMQQLKEKNEIADAEAAAEVPCDKCAGNAAPELVVSNSAPQPAPRRETGELNPRDLVVRIARDEVALFFSATEHKKSVIDLTQADIGISDDNRAPAAILGFRNESQLPLRLGLVVDTSNSVTQRFAFEQAAANKFLKKVLVNPEDLAFVVGVNNSVLMVQDFTADLTKVSHELNQLAPGGGTALWDAIAFSADKLANRPETTPVARMLVVISDGDDNSSSATLKEAIATAQRGEVAIYTVSTRELYIGPQDNDFVGDHALRTLSELTGGATFVPGSVDRLNGSLNDLQQAIRGRYLVSYKPAAFERDGRYRAIDITATKNGKALKVFARKGYYASDGQPSSDH